MAKKEALWLAKEVTIITRRQSEEKGKGPVALLQRLFILPAIT